MYWMALNKHCKTIYLFFLGVRCGRSHFGSRQRSGWLSFYRLHTMAFFERGGARQLAAAVAQADSGPAQHSIFIERLLKLFGWGLLSAPTCQWLAEGAYEDGLLLEEVQRMRGVGTSGAYSGNCRRDLLRAFCGSMAVAKPIEITVPMKSKLNVVRPHPTSMISPTLFIESIYTKYPLVFEHMFTGMPPRTFWEKVDPSDPKFLSLGDELKGKQNWQDRAIPYIIHGDGAIFTAKDGNTLLTVSMRSLLAKRFKSTILPFFSIPKVVRADGDDDCVLVMWKMLVHFLNGAFAGKHPELDHEGDPWPRGPLRDAAGADFVGNKFFFVLWSIQGDLEYLSNELHMPHFNAVRPCSFCAVSRAPGDPSPLTDCSLAASWKGTIVSPAEGVFVPISTHPIFSITGASRWHCPGDLMHTGDLGVVQYLIGSILEELADEWPGPLTSIGKVDQIYRAIRSKYDDRQTSNRLSTLKREMFSRRHDFPLLRAKAAESRALLFAVRDICADVFDCSDRDEHRLRCVSALCNVYEILQSGDVIMNSVASQNALNSYEVFLLHYHWLLKRSLCNGIRRYGFYFKFHNMWHILEAARWINPCHTWCYDFEGFMHNVVAAGRACVAGSSMEIIGSKILQNFLLVFELEARSYR